MATKPTSFPDWATTLTTDPTSGENNRVEPPSSKKESGWDRREIPPRQWFNWNQYNNSQWIRWFDQEISGLGSASGVEADQNLRTTDDVSFNSVTIDGQSSATERSQLIELAGDFDAGQDILVARAGRVVTISATQASYTHSSTGTVNSGAVLPSWAIPADLNSSVYEVGTSGDFGIMKASSTGGIALSRRDSSGAVLTRTTSSGNFCISFVASS